METSNIEDVFYLIERGDRSAYFTPSELVEVIARLRNDNRRWKERGFDTWRVVKFERYPRHGVVRIWFESIYYDAAYKPRVWRC